VVNVQYKSNYVNIMSKKKESRDPFDGEYVGNIWGWKFSLMGGAVILFLLSVAMYRHYSLDVPIGFDEPVMESIQQSTPVAEQDTI
jgi:hypothetical protein